jgi:hypothetical protein
MKAYKIDVEKKDIFEIEIKTITDIYEAIGNNCEIFSCPYEMKNGDTVYVDDEGLLQENVFGCFLLKGFDNPLVGNSVIINYDKTGEKQNVKTSIDNLKRSILWGDRHTANSYRNSFLMNDMRKIVMN